MTINIAGAGLAGLLAANMLRQHNPVVYETQPTLPHNHSAVLRFRTSVVGDTLGVPFKKVKMIKAAHPWRNPVADALSYSIKNTTFIRSDRSITAGLTVADRFIAPPDLVAQMAMDLDIKFSCAKDDFFDNRPCPMISTIPMPALMKLLEYPNQPQFDYYCGYNVRLKLKRCDAYASLMVPDPNLPFARLSLTGDELIIECPGSDVINLSKVDFADTVDQACNLMGFGRTEQDGAAEIFKSEYAKILPIPERERKEFLFWATHTHGVYSLGRFATWRPNLLLDDLVQDVRLISRWMNNADSYSMRRAS